MELLEKILAKDNMNQAYKKVVSNKGVAGVDGITVDEVDSYIRDNKERIFNKIRKRYYKPKPVLRVQIPKDNGKKRNLGIPTVMDRIIQQAMVQVLSPIFEEQFSENSYGFRPGRSCEQAVTKVLEYFNAILVKWVMRKYKRKNSKKKAINWLAEIAQRDTNLFAHWKYGVLPMAW